MSQRSRLRGPVHAPRVGPHGRRQPAARRLDAPRSVAPCNGPGRSPPAPTRRNATATSPTRQGKLSGQWTGHRTAGTAGPCGDCGQPLYLKPGNTTVTCREHDPEWTGNVAERRGWMLGEVSTTLAHAALAVHLLGAHATPV